MADIEDEADIPAILLPCTTCNRTFKPESLGKHTKVCAKTAAKKRKTFDSSKQRIQGTELAEFLPTIVLLNKKEKQVKKIQSKWKERHMELVRAVRAARGLEVSPRPTGSATKLCDHEKCPHCDRQFGPKAYDRHIEWCKEQKARIPKSPSTTKAKERLEARLKYRAPALMKSRPMLIREKYSSAANLVKSGPAAPAVPNQQSEPQKSVAAAEKTPSKPHEAVRSTAKPTLQRNASISGPRSSMRQRSVSPVKRVSSQTATKTTATTAKSEASPQVRKGKDTKLKDLVSPNTNPARSKANTPATTPHSSKSKSDDVHQEKRNAASLKPPSPITRKLSNTTVNSEGDASAAIPTPSLNERLRGSISVMNCASQNSNASEPPPGTAKTYPDGSHVSLIPTKFNLSKKFIQLNDVSVNTEMPEIKVSQIKIILGKPPSQLVTWKQIADVPEVALMKQCDDPVEESDCDSSSQINRTYAIDNISVDSIETSSICQDENSNELHFHVESAQSKETSHICQDDERAELDFHVQRDRLDIEENQPVSLYSLSSVPSCKRKDSSKNKISKPDENSELPDSLEATTTVGTNGVNCTYSWKTWDGNVSGAQATKSYTLLDSDLDVFKTEEISDSSTPVKEEFQVEIPKLELKNIGSGTRTNSNTRGDASTENAVFDTGSLADLDVIHDCNPTYGDVSLPQEEVGYNESQYGSIITDCEVTCDTGYSVDHDSLTNADENDRGLKEVYHHGSSESEQGRESCVDSVRQETDLQCGAQNYTLFNFHAFPSQPNTKKDLKLGSCSKTSRQKVMSGKKLRKVKIKLESIFKCKRPKLKCKKSKSCTCEKSFKIYKHLVGDQKWSGIAKNIWSSRHNSNQDYECNFKIQRNRCEYDQDLESSPEKLYSLDGEWGYRSNVVATRDDDGSSLDEEGCGLKNCDCEMNIIKVCGLNEEVMGSLYVDRDLHVESDELSDTVNESCNEEEGDCILEKAGCRKFCNDSGPSFEILYVDNQTESNSMDDVEQRHSQAKAPVDSESLATTVCEHIVLNNYLGNNGECVAFEFCDIEPKILKNSSESGTCMPETVINLKSGKEFRELPGEGREPCPDFYILKQPEEMYLNLESSTDFNCCTANEFREVAEMCTHNGASTLGRSLVPSCSILDEEVCHAATVNEVVTIQPVMRKVENETDILERTGEKEETAQYSATEKCNSAPSKKRSFKSKKSKSKENNGIKMKVKKRQPSLTKGEKHLPKKLVPVSGKGKSAGICDVQQISVRLNSEPDPRLMRDTTASRTEFEDDQSPRETEISTLHSLKPSDLLHRESFNEINNEINFINKEFKLPAIVSNSEREMSARYLFTCHNNTASETSKLTVSQLPTFDGNIPNKSFLPDIGVSAPFKASSQCNELNAPCFTVQAEIGDSDEANLLCAPSKIPRPLFKKQMCKSDSQVMKVHHLPSLDPSLVKFSRSEKYPVALVSDLILERLVVALI